MVDIESMSVPQAAQALQLNLNTAYGRLRTAVRTFRPHSSGCARSKKGRATI